jgi:hypothetical protein
MIKERHGKPLRDPVRVVFPHWVAAISIIVCEIATQKRAKTPFLPAMTVV